jgi:hypothetical protein
MVVRLGPLATMRLRPRLADTAARATGPVMLAGTWRTRDTSDIISASTLGRHSEGKGSWRVWDGFSVVERWGWNSGGGLEGSGLPHHPSPPTSPSLSKRFLPAEWLSKGAVDAALCRTHSMTLTPARVPPGLSERRKPSWSAAGSAAPRRFRHPLDTRVTLEWRNSAITIETLNTILILTVLTNIPSPPTSPSLSKRFLPAEWLSKGAVDAALCRTHSKSCRRTESAGRESGANAAHPRDRTDTTGFSIGGFVHQRVRP